MVWKRSKNNMVEEAKLINDSEFVFALGSTVVSGLV